MAPGKFHEVYSLAKDYAEREGEGAGEFHVKALDLIAGTYKFRFEGAVPPDARKIVESILERYDYGVHTDGLGSLDKVAVQAVVAASMAAGVTGDRKAFRWGTRMLTKILDKITDDFENGNFVSLITDDVEVVTDGLKELAAMSDPIYRGTTSAEGN